MTCLECGATCCPSCTFIFESATYCSHCAESILGGTLWGSGRRSDGGERRQPEGREPAGRARGRGDGEELSGRHAEGGAGRGAPA